MRLSDMSFPGCNCDKCKADRESTTHHFDEGESLMKTTMTRKFYKTHSALQRPQILKLYSEALADATKAIQDGTQEEYYIVEVKAIVRRQSSPIIVEEVR